MQVSSVGVDLIKKFEGCRLTAYQDAVGVWTIGYGITNYDKDITGITIQSGVKISQAQADSWLMQTLNKKFAPMVDAYTSTYKWTQNEFDALVSFAYNIGNVKGITSNGTRSKIEISNSFTSYVHAGGKVLTGLVNRRKAEKALFDNPNSSNGTFDNSSSTDNSGGTSSALSDYLSIDGIVRQFAYISDDYKATPDKTKLGLSIINYTSLIADVTAQFGINTNSAENISTIGGTSGNLAGKSGATLSVQKTINIPISNCILHGGDDCTDYSYWAGKMGYTQGKVGKEWLNRNQPHVGSHGPGVLDGHVTIAMRPTFGSCGDLVKVTCSDGSAFTAILADIKGSDATSQWGHVKGNDVSPCEWYYYSGSTTVNSAGKNFEGIGDFKGKQVVKVENYGSWYNN